MYMQTIKLKGLCTLWCCRVYQERMAQRERRVLVEDKEVQEMM